MTKMLLVCLPDEVAAQLAEMAAYSKCCPEHIAHLAIRAAYVDHLEEKRAEAQHCLRVAMAKYEINILNKDDKLDDELPF